uniref:RNA polymerase I subunit E n=1 Tax=Oncorhynchus tshawytscha TaxID=74940 RepID=A0AAZ3RB27_ONCTS
MVENDWNHFPVLTIRFYGYYDLYYYDSSSHTTVEKIEQLPLRPHFSNGTLRNTQQLDFSFYKNVDETNPRKKNRRLLVAESDRLSYVDSLIEAFGTNKQKRALTSRRLNQVGSETLQSAVAKAAHTIIDQKGLEALQQEVVQAESQSEVSHYLPPCYPDADTPQHVYLFDDSILHLDCVFGQEEGCPRIIHIKLMRTFTVETFNNGRVHYLVSTSMRVKVAAYCLALLLHMGDMTADLTLLHRDLGVTEKRMVEVAKSMGLTLSRHGCVTGDDGGPTAENRLASLRLPLVKYQTITQCGLLEMNVLLGVPTCNDAVGVIEV